MNKINPRKLLNTKWTAVKPQNRERHFMVTELEFDEQGAVTRCLLEAVLTRRAEEIDWQQLKDTQRWRQGWS